MEGGFSGNWTVMAIGSTNGSNFSHVPSSEWSTSEMIMYYLRPGFILATAAFGIPTIPLLLAVTLTKSYRHHSYATYLTVMSVYDIAFLLLETISMIMGLSGFGDLRAVLIWDIPCRFYDHFFYVSFNISMWLNLGLAFDRLVVIVLPFQKQRLCTRKSSWIVCGGIMLVQHGAGLAYLFQRGTRYSPWQQSNWCPNKAHHTSFLMFFVFSTIAAMMGIVAACLISIIKLYLISIKRKTMTAASGKKGERTSRATISLLAIGIGTFVTRSPIVLTELLFFFPYHFDKALLRRLMDRRFTNWMPYLSLIGIGMAYLNFIQNFYILFIMNAQFRQDIRKLLRCGAEPATEKQQAPKEKVGSLKAD